MSRKWVKNRADEIAVDEGCEFVEANAKRVCTFFEQFLHHSKGEWAGQAFKLLDWQREQIIYPLFGWVRADGTRRDRVDSSKAVVAQAARE